MIQYLRESGRQIVEPALLGLPVTAGKTEWTLSRATDRIVTGLVTCEESIVRQIMFDLLLAKMRDTTPNSPVFAGENNSLALLPASTSLLNR